MLNAVGLGFLFKAKDEASHVVHHLHDGLHDLKKAGNEAGSSVSKALGMSGKAIAVTVAAIAAIGAGAAFEFAEQAERFSQAIRQAGVASHATAHEMHELEELALHKGLDSVRGSAMTAGETLAELAKEGYDARASAEALNGTLMLMKISMGALGSQAAAGIVNDTLGQFGMEASQAGELTDKLAFAMKEFGFRSTELQGTMAGLASGAQLTGASLEDTLISVGLMKTVLPSATKAASSMNAAMQQLASTHGQKELRGIGVAVTDNTGKIKPLIDILGQLAAKTANMTEGQVAHKLATIAGGRAAGGLSVIMEALRKGVSDGHGTLLTGAAAIEHLRVKIAGAAGTAKQMSDVLSDDLGGAIKALKNAVSNAAIVIGAPFEGFFKNIVEKANLLIRGLTQLFTQGGFSGEIREALDKNLGLKGFVVGAFMWIKRLQNLLSSLGDSFTTTFAPFRPVIDELLGAFRSLGVALGIVNQSADQNASTWDTFGGAGAAVGEILAYIAGTVIPLFAGGIQLLTGLVEVFKAAWENLAPTLAVVGQILKGAFEVIAGIVTGDWGMMWNGLIDIVVGSVKAIVRLVIGMVSMIAGAFDSLAEVFGFDSGLGKQVESLKAFADSGLDSLAVKLKTQVSPTASAAPAVAAQGGLRAAIAGAAPAPAGAGGDTHLHTHVMLDGSKIAEIQALAKRSDKARSFVPVPAHGGAF